MKRFTNPFASGPVVAWKQSFRRASIRRKGAMLVLICVMIFAFLATVAFSVDIAYMHLVRAELRTATDAAAKAAAEALSRTQDIDEAVAQGQRVAAANLVAGEPLQLARTDFSFGRSEQQPDGKFLFATSGVPLNSVRVAGDKTNASLSGGVTLFFGRMMGVTSFEPRESSAATYIERDIGLVVDRSGSMFGQKFRDLQEAVRIFIATLEANPTEERVGLASYSTFASEDVPLTKDLSEINRAMTGMPVTGLTSISRGIIAGEGVMATGRSRDFVERTLIVMTDGQHNRGQEPRIPARRLADDGIKIFTITFGRNADQARMREIASIGGGKHFHANNGTQLKAVFREIAVTLNTIVTE
jgi:Mg-chelatase subunit ChlD